MKKKRSNPRRDPAGVYLRKAFRGNQLCFAGLLFCQLLAAALNTCIAALLQQVIDTAAGQSSVTLRQLLMLTLALVLVFLVVELLERETASRFVRRANRQYKRGLFEDILKKSLASFTTERTGEYISMLSVDAKTIEERYFCAISQIVLNVALVLFSLALMLYYSWGFALLVLILSAMPLLLSVMFGGGMAKAESRVSTCAGEAAAEVKDLLSGFSVVKSFQAEREAAAQFVAKDDELEQAKFGRTRLRLLCGTVAGGAAFLMQLGVFLAGAYASGRGWITVGSIVAFLQLSGMLVSPLQSLPAQLAELRGARELAKKAAETLGRNAARGGEVPLCGIGDGIRCTDLYFGYEGGQDILKGVRLRLRPGKSYAVVGASGSGKTTLLNLLLGSYDGYRGSIRIGGVELRQARMERLYELMAMIQQNVFVFDATIVENITMFKQFPEAEIAEAIRRSGLESLIAQKGRDYRCGENGCNLSGGERQRISIARALLKDAQVLLMDEATAALDSRTAANVIGAILDVEGLTRVVVTHKLDGALLRRFDEILVLHGGVIAEAGSFDELLEQDGYFRALFRVAQDGESGDLAGV